MKDIISVYLRTSLEDYGKAHRLLDQSFSIMNQRKLIQAYCADHEELKERETVEYIDDGFTGTNTNRPRFQDMLRDIKNGRIGVVIVKDLSRLGRSYLEVGDYLERVFPLAGIRVIAINDGYDSADFNGTTGGINVAFRNFIYDSYSKDLSTKVRSAMRVRMERGKFINHAPYGYMKSPKDKHQLIPDPQTAPVVQKIFSMVLAGKSTSMVATWLNDENVPTPLQYKRHKLRTECQDRKLLWSHIMVINILHNYKYTGAMVNHTRESRELRDRNQRRTSSEEWIITEDTHEPLVSKENFERANAALRHPQKVQRRSRKSVDAVFYCGHCGRKLHKTVGRDIYFSCDTPSYQTEAACRGLRWSKSELEKVLCPVYHVQLDLLGEKATEMQKESARSQANVFARQLGQIERELQGIDRRRMQLFEDYHDAKLELDAYMEQKTALLQRGEQLRADRINVETDYHKYLERQEERQAEKKRLDSFLSDAQLPTDQLIPRMYEAIERVNVFENKIEIHWKFEDVFTESNVVRSRAS